MTIPTLINKTDKQEYVSKLKKAYSTMTQATNRIIAEEGSPKNWIQAGDIDGVYTRYKKYLSVAKDCGTATGCLNQFGSGSAGYKYLSGGGAPNWNSSTDNRRLVLSDGMQVIFHSNPLNNNCSFNAWGSLGICTVIFIDVNGEKGPNRYGRDYFVFALKENGLYPVGCESAFCQGTAGDGCTCKVLRENAMNY